jgi:hypothetical protein
MLLLMLLHHAGTMVQLRAGVLLVSMLAAALLVAPSAALLGKGGNLGLGGRFNGRFMATAPSAAGEFYNTRTYFQQVAPTFPTTTVQQVAVTAAPTIVAAAAPNYVPLASQAIVQQPTMVAAAPTFVASQPVVLQQPVAAPGKSIALDMNVGLSMNLQKPHWGRH